MLMGNLLDDGGVLRGVMSSAQPRLGVRHPTVVPANFESPAEAEANADGETSPAARRE